MTRYELLDRIGVGGMAEIFRGKAVAAGGFEKPVAIKRILPHLSQDPRFVELLIAEAKVLSLLKHRNIVQIFDVGLGDDGKYFLVMEYVDGKDLGAVQRGLEARGRRRMPFDLALHIGAEICEALEHAHSARAPDGKPMSLVHRDVSPSNVLLSRAGEVKLTDFGIAKRAEQEVTGHGSVRGKFAYISPEQARNEHIDPRSDVFSVGILLWELIVNRRLFSGLGDLEALRAVREAQVPRPAEVDPRLSSELDQLLMSALARDIKSRPTAGQLGAKLRAMRYALEVTVGDPATELAKIIETADEVERQSSAPPLVRAGSFDHVEQGEPTVFRIRTADAFQMRDKDGGVARAKQVIDRFEEEETRQAKLSGDQLRILRSGQVDSAELAPIAPPLPGMPRPRRSHDELDEPTVARPPLRTDEVATFGASGIDELPPTQSFDADESTRLVTRERRTPMPQRQPRPSSAPGQQPGTMHGRSGPSGMPGLPPRARGPTPPPPLPPNEPLAPMPPLGSARPHGTELTDTPTPMPLPPAPGAPVPLPPPPAALPPTPIMRPGPPAGQLMQQRPSTPPPVQLARLAQSAAQAQAAQAQQAQMPQQQMPPQQMPPQQMPPQQMPPQQLPPQQLPPQQMPQQLPQQQMMPPQQQMPPQQMPPQQMPQPMRPQQMPPQQMPQAAMPVQLGPGYPGWAGQPGPMMPPQHGGPVPDLYDPRRRQPRAQLPAQGTAVVRRRPPALQPWMLVVGLLMAALAFVVTRLLLQ